MALSAHLSPISYSRFFCWTGIVSFAILCALAQGRALQRTDQKNRLPDRTPLYLTNQPARNPERLTLAVDADRVVGWLSGTANHAGAEAKVTVGDKTQTVRIGEDNSFAWPYKVSKQTRAAIAFR